MHDHSNYPIIWLIYDGASNVLGQTIQLTREAAEIDARNRFSRTFDRLEDSGKRKPPNKCCNRCGDKPCG